MIEARVLAQYCKTYELSEQQLVSCAPVDFGSGCCGGTSSTLKYYYNNGPMEANCTDYPSGKNTYYCCPCLKKHGGDELPFRTYYYYTVQLDQTHIKTSIYHHGPAYFRFDVYDDFIKFWNCGEKGQVYKHTGTGALRGGHAVLVYGWDDSKDAYKCKNSWGATSGLDKDGTFWMTYNGTGLEFGVANVKAVASPLKYGDEYHIQNVYNNWESYLDTCGNASCNGNLYAVSTSSKANRDAAGSGIWEIISASEKSKKSEGDTVLTWDTIHLKNKYKPESFLDTCDHVSCGGNKYEVSTSTKKNRDNGSGIWRFLPNRQGIR